MKRKYFIVISAQVRQNFTERKVAQYTTNVETRLPCISDVAL